MGTVCSYTRFFAQVWFLTKKDLLIEWRTKEILTTTVFFAVLIAILCSIACHLSGIPPICIAAPALWLSIAFSSLFSVGRMWQRERDNQAMTVLLLAPIARSSIFLAKVLGMLICTTLMECLVLPVIAVLTHLNLVEILLPLLLLLLLGNIGIAFMGTLFGFMTIRTRARDLAIASVVLPILTPSLLCAVAGTRELLEGAITAEWMDWVLLLLVFDGVAATLSLATFYFLLEE
ncbi:heme exporter protein CcmB [Pajaroellobacter abortibovis]|uniref:Uncharacterized protein n=1 Tax=Pajaroellobacter abortibovis TaxID=1882918 RepID=A0A1L6MYN5_9BACT|nr:heme exporter protein CcmB [Pajaroellobacter abortibovis]APS00643.1 hypothetical protein BCY86_08130 [Pajaroellobacter abortibovis]